MSVLAVKSASPVKSALTAALSAVASVFANIAAAGAVANAVENHRQPSEAALRTLGLQGARFKQYY